MRLGTYILTGALVLCARSQSQFSGFRYTVSATPDQYGIFRVAIENRSKIPITAVHAFRSCRGIAGTDHTSGVNGSDSLVRFLFQRPAHVEIVLPSLVRPGETLQMDLPVIDAVCPKGVSVLFEDGHGEGDDDPDFGWHRMIADRFSTYDELLKTRRLVEAFDAGVPDYPAALLNVLDARRYALAKRNQSEVPATEVPSRNAVLEALLVRLRLRSERDFPVELKSRDTTLTLLDAWMAPLKAHGYDRSITVLTANGND